ncbi:hypothetical protein U1Q18_049170, partial [Sarracenia purpurea var. burkii]
DALLNCVWDKGGHPVGNGAPNYEDQRVGSCNKSEDFGLGSSLKDSVLPTRDEAGASQEGKGHALCSRGSGSEESYGEYEDIRGWEAGAKHGSVISILCNRGSISIPSRRCEQKGSTTSLEFYVNFNIIEPFFASLKLCGLDDFIRRR